MVFWEFDSVDPPRAGARRAGARGTRGPATASCRAEARCPTPAQRQGGSKAQPAAPTPGPAASKPGEGGKPRQGTPRKPGRAELAAAEARLSEAARRNPDSFEAHRALAGFYLQQGRPDAALPHLERARTIDPAHYATGYDLALALLETGKLDRARDEVQRMLGAKETAELLNLLGDIYERADNRVAAAEAYQRAARMDPTEEHLFDWGNNLVQLRAFESATEVFAAAIKRHPESGRLHVALGIAQVLARAIRGRRQLVLPGGGSRAVGSASLPVSRRDVRRRPRARRRDYEAAHALRESAAEERAGPLSSGNDSLERTACRLAPGRCAPCRGAAQTSGRARSDAREGLPGARDPALGSAAVQGSDSGPASPRHAWSRGWRRRTTGWRRRTSGPDRPSWR